MRRKEPAESLAPAARASASAGGADTTGPAAEGMAAPLGAWHLSIDQGKASVDMPGLKEDIQGEATAARGTLDVVPADLARSRGTVAFDLGTFATHTFHSDKDATQTEHAQTWLEVKVGDKRNEDMRWASFTIRRVDRASAPTLAGGVPSKDGADDVRTVTLTVHGDLQIHGHTMPQEDVVDVAFHFAPGTADGAPPTRVEVRSKQPMHVTLKDYDVKPRDPAGQLLAWTTQLLSKVAETADVTVTLTATPRHGTD